jgi:hypothetical protein
MSSPSSINNANYDPKTDKAWKAKSNDPGWKYGYWSNLGNRDQVACTLCDSMVCGGIKRLKQHLAGGYGDTKMCPETTTAIRKEMRNYLESNKRKRPLFLDDDKEQVDPDVVMVVDLEQEDGSGTARTGSSQTARVVPSSGTAAKQRRAFDLYKAPTPRRISQLWRCFEKHRRKLLMKGVKAKGVLTSQPTIAAKMKSKEEKNYVDMQWALWFYECGVPFNAAASRQFQIAIEATTHFGSGYIAPSPYELREPMLQKAVKMTSNL